MSAKNQTNGSASGTGGVQDAVGAQVLPGAKPPLPADEWYRIRLAHVTGQGANRLTVGTFLGGAALAAYAALQPPTPNPSNPPSDSGYCHTWDGPCFFQVPKFDLGFIHVKEVGFDQSDLLCVHVFLGISSVLFLLSVLFTYRALALAGYLTDDELADKASYEEPIRKGHTYYHNAGILIVWGVCSLVASLAALACRISSLSALISGVIALGFLLYSIFREDQPRIEPNQPVSSVRSWMPQVRR